MHPLGSEWVGSPKHKSVRPTDPRIQSKAAPQVRLVLNAGVRITSSKWQTSTALWELLSVSSAILASTSPRGANELNK